MRQAFTLMAWFLVLTWIALASVLFALIIAASFDPRGPDGDQFVPLLGALVFNTAMLVAMFRMASRAERRNLPTLLTEHPMEADEAQFFRDFHASLARMEQRIGALEILLLDRSPRVPLERT